MTPLPASQGAATFSCGRCNRQFPWSPQIAGRTARCKCGLLIRVPQSLAAAPAQSLPPAIPTASPAPVIPAAATVEYQIPRDEMAAAKFEERSTDKLRDLYLPPILFGVGILAVALWAGLRLHASFHGVETIVSIFAAGMVIKTAILFAIAFAMSSQMDFNLGNPLMAILKIATILILCDATMLWVHALLQTSGAVSPGHIFGPRGTITVYLISGAIVVGLASWFLLDIDADSIKPIAISLAVASQLMNFGMLMITGTVIRTTFIRPTATPPVRVIAAAPATSSSPAAPLESRLEVDMQADKEISRSLNSWKRYPDARAWQNAHRANLNAAPVITLIDTLYKAGAPNIYVDRIRLIVEMPTNPAQRNAIVAMALAHRNTNMMPVQRSPTAKYLELAMPPDLTLQLLRENSTTH